MFGTRHRPPEEVRSDDELRRNALTAAPLLVAYVTETTTDLYRQENGQFWWGDEQPMLARVVLGDIIFHLHLIDRFIFADLGEERRAIFMDALLAVVRDVLVRAFETPKEAEQFGRDFRRAYNEAQVFYSQYKRTLPEKADGLLQDTLYWEFAISRARSIGQTNPIRIQMILLHTMDATKDLVQMFKRARCSW